MEAIMNFIQETGFYRIVTGDWKVLIMMVISFALLYLAIVKKFEPLLLVPIAFGMLITNLPGAEMYHEILFAGGHVNWEIFGGGEITMEFIQHLQEIGVSTSATSIRWPTPTADCSTTSIRASSWASTPV